MFCEGSRLLDAPACQLRAEDTVEYFNLILGTKLAPQEKQDLVAFLRTL
jgi:hypothetical protein